VQFEMAVGLSTAVGSLPHVDPRAAAELSLRCNPGLPAIPSLPMRSPWEAMLGQAVAGLPGVTVGDRGLQLVDGGPKSDAVPETDLDHEAFGGLRAFLEVANGHRGPVKWQVTGPVTLGLGLLHAGIPADVAFGLSEAAVQARVTALGAAIADALPDAPQVIVIDEPGLTGLAHPGFPLEPERAIALVGSCVSTAESFAWTGVHCCGSTDWSLVEQSGVSILSLPADHGAVRFAGTLADFMARGGRIAWGAVPTDGPRAGTADRHWRALAAVWCELVRAGCDPVRLRTQAIITPECGLMLHTAEQAEQVLALTQEIADRVLDQAVATRFSLGA
jgi:methionine synthase II (cobalamin-independent)